MGVLCVACVISLIKGHAVIDQQFKKHDRKIRRELTRRFKAYFYDRIFALDAGNCPVLSNGRCHIRCRVGTIVMQAALRHSVAPPSVTV